MVSDLHTHDTGGNESLRFLMIIFKALFKVQNYF